MSQPIAGPGDADDLAEHFEAGSRTGGPVLVRANALELALRASTAMRSGYRPRAFCVDLGRSLLLAELKFSSWVLRRVERIEFMDDRNLHREMAIELNVRKDAPVLVDHAGDRFWVVPLMMMRRQTLVDFHMRDENRKDMTMPGLRLVQQLDQSLLLAAAAAASTGAAPNLADEDAVRRFAQMLVTGTAEEVEEAWREYLGPSEGGPLVVLRQSSLFHSVARLLRNNFTLYALLPVTTSRQRLLHLSFVEPVRWRYQLPCLVELDGSPGTWLYGASQAGSWAHLRSSHLLALVGLTATRIRFQVPSAERAASYHVELVAPPGVRIGRASLIAGRPNDPDAHRSGPGGPSSRLTVDHEESATLRVGLHAVEVPPGSLCRAQVELRVQSAGWLAVIVTAAIAISSVLFAVAWRYRDADGIPTVGDEHDNVVVLLLTTAAAAATVVTHREFGGVAARLLAGVRTLAALCMALPVVAAGVITFQDTNGLDGPEVSTSFVLWCLFGVAAAITLFLVNVFRLSRKVERVGRPRSPWNMTPERRRNDSSWRHPFRRPPVIDDEAVPDGAQTARRDQRSFHEALKHYGFDRPSVGIPSSDAWHERYDVTDDSHADAVRRLLEITPPSATRDGDRLMTPSRCPRWDLSSCCRRGDRTAVDAVVRLEPCPAVPPGLLPQKGADTGR